MSREGSGSGTPVFRGAFLRPGEEFNGSGKIPMIFDILAPDGVTSILPDNLRMILDVNPQSAAFSYSQVIERTQTKGGFVEFHWGEGLRSIDLNMVTGGFKRLYSGLSNITGGGLDVGGNRRETINYSKYLDMLALFHNNGQITDINGTIVFSGQIRIMFDGGIYIGWFDSFSVAEAAGKPFQFELTTKFTIDKEILRFRTMPYNQALDSLDSRTGAQTAGRRVSGDSSRLLQEQGLDASLADLLSIGQIGSGIAGGG